MREAHAPGRPPQCRSPGRDGRSRIRRRDGCAPRSGRRARLDAGEAPARARDRSRVHRAGRGRSGRRRARRGPRRGTGRGRGRTAGSAATGTWTAAACRRGRGAAACASRAYGRAHADETRQAPGGRPASRTRSRPTPRFIRKPSPTSTGGFGSDPAGRGPRGAVEVGHRHRVAAVHDVEQHPPAALRAVDRQRGSTRRSSKVDPARSRRAGASATSVMRRSPRVSGSMAKCRRPFSSS